MVWQDILISLSNLLFTYSLVHQVIHGFKKRRGFLTLTSSGLTSFGLYIMSAAFISLDLMYSGVVAFINGTLWLTLFIQRKKYGGA